MNTLKKGPDRETGSQAEEDMKCGNKHSNNIISNISSKLLKEKKSHNRRRKRRKLRKEKKKYQQDQQESEILTIQSNRQYEKEQESWGDEITIDEQWPEETKAKTLRIVHYNANGIVAENCYMEWETLLHSLQDIQADVFCLNETKIDTRQHRVRNNIQTIGKKIDPNIKLVMESSLQPPRVDRSIFKPGGTLLGVKGTWSGRCIPLQNDYTKDKLGRWSATHMQGRGGQVLTILSVYRVCKQETGKNTAYLQQQADLMKSRKRILDPREVICRDLQVILEKLNRDNHKIILCADINDEADKIFANKWNEMLEKTGMRNAHQALHPGNNLPRTYDQGQRCIDMIAISKNIPNQMIKKSGILPFYTLSASDHRALYIDVDVYQLFDEIIPDVTNHSYRRFHTKNVKKCSTYLKHLDRYFEESRIYKKIMQLKNEINEYLKKESERKLSDTQLNTTKQIIAEKLEKLDKKRWELMIAAEKKCGTAPMKGKKWFSTKLQQAAQALSQAKKRIRYLYTQDELKEDELETAKRARVEALQQLRHVQKEDRKYRDEMLDDLAKKKAKAWKMKAEHAAKMLKSAEKSSDIYSRITTTIKGYNKSGVRSLMVPTSVNTGKKINEATDCVNGNWKQIRDTDAIYETLLIQNAKSLIKSNEAITATGPFSAKLGHDSENLPFVETILNGTLDSKYYSKFYPTFQKEAEIFMKQMKYNKHCKAMDWNFGKKEYKELFGKTRENTSCGPSGLHMSHWCAALEHDNIMEVHSTFIWAAFKLGISYTRWQISWHCMIQKLSQPYSHKLRIIQLFEGDFNGGLKYIFGRLFMRKMVAEGIIEPHAYGSIPGKDSLEAMKLLQYLYENHRILKRDLIVIFNDAAGCYDRVRPNHAELCSLRLGCPRTVTQTHTITQNRMIHHVKTSSGVSKGNIKWKEIHGEESLINHITSASNTIYGNIGGIGQGGGASPVEWLAVLLVMIETFKQFSSGADILDPNGNYSLHIPIVSYVDDNSIVKSLERLKDCDTIFEEASAEMTHWKRILRVTGGDLAPQKCTVALMKWKWNESRGYSRMMTKQEAPGTINISDRTEGSDQTVLLRRLEVNEGDRQLGIILPLDGSFTQERQRRETDCKNLGRALYNSSLTHEESVIVYRVYYIPKVSYPLSITKFKQKECNTMQSWFYRYALPKMGLNRHTPKALLHGPMDLGGLELHDMYTEQLTRHLEKIQQHIRRNDNIGRAFLCNLVSYEIVIGSSKPLFKINPWRYCYGEQTSTIFYLWRMIRQWKLNLDIPHQHPFPQQYPNESNTIMDDAVWDPLYNTSLEALQAINSCRLFHGITYPSDMLNYDGTTLRQSFLYGRGSNRKTRHKEWPHQPVPNAKQWTTWRRFIRQHYVQNSISVNPVMRLQSTHQNITLWNPTYNKQQPVLTTLHHIHPSYQPFLQYSEGLDANLDYMYKAYLNNKLHLATDGSHLPETTRGTGAAIMARDGDTTILIMGGCQCQAENEMTSMTTEHYGTICGLLLIHILLSSYDSPPIRKITLWIDNEEVHTRAKNASQKQLKLRSFQQRDYALNSHMKHLINTLTKTCSIQFKKVKGHQEGEFDDLPFEAQMNTLADEGAEFIRIKIFGPQQKTLPLPDEGMWIVDSNGIQLHDYRSLAYLKVKGQDLLTYLCDRNQWTKQTYHSIDWISLSKRLQQLKKSKQMSYIQLIHNWQNTGYQKQQFARSKYQNRKVGDSEEERLIDREITRCGQCPYKCGNVETHLHYLVCTNTEARRKRTAAINKMRDTLQKSNIYGAIISFMILGLTWDDQSQPPIYNINFNRIDPIIGEAVHEQTSIGWNNVKRGLLSQKWAQAQRTHIDLLKTSQQKEWGQVLTTAVLEVSWGLWVARNKHLHGKRKDELKEEILKDLCAKVDLLYTQFKKDKRQYDEHLQNIYKFDKQHLKKKGMSYLKTWIITAEEALEDYDRRQMGSIKKWLIQTHSRKKSEQH